MIIRSAALAGGLLAGATLMFSAAARDQSASAAETGWRTFSGSWSAIGRRDTLPIENSGAAAVVRLSGAVVLGAGSGLTSGFRGEAIGFDDGHDRGQGRAVWTDARGDRIFSAFAAEPLAAGRRVSATITGGSGRYSGISGEYSLTWQYVVDAGDETVQGRTVDLTGRFQLAGTGR